MNHREEEYEIFTSWRDLSRRRKTSVKFTPAAAAAAAAAGVATCRAETTGE